jgi:hypothetical protein
MNLLLPGVMKLLDKIIPDPKLKRQAEKELTKHMAEVIKAESSSESWMTRTWRPYLMFSITNLIVIWGLNNFLIAPYVEFFFGSKIPLLGVPPELWNLILVGFGIYGGARTFEKVMDKAMKIIGGRK